MTPIRVFRCPRPLTAPTNWGGEARNGRSMDALLAAYRVGARVAWRELSATAVSAGLPATTIARFAELVFAYIDELSASSVSGHADESATEAGSVSATSTCSPPNCSPAIPEVLRSAPSVPIGRFRKHLRRSCCRRRAPVA